MHPAAEHRHLLACLVGHLVAQVLLDPLGQVADAAQRRLEIVGGDVRELVEILVAVRQRLDEPLPLLLGALAIVDVGVNTDPLADRSVALEDGDAARPVIMVRAVVATHPVLDLVDPARRQRALPERDGVLPVVRWMASAHP